MANLSCLKVLALYDFTDTNLVFLMDWKAKKGSVLFNDAFNIFHVGLYGI